MKWRGEGVKTREKDERKVGQKCFNNSFYENMEKNTASNMGCWWACSILVLFMKNWAEHGLKHGYVPNP